MSTTLCLENVLGFNDFNALVATLGQADHRGGDGFCGHRGPGAEQADGVQGPEGNDASLLAESVTPIADEGRRPED